MFLPSLVDPAIGLRHLPARPSPVLHHVHPSETRAVAEGFIAARTRRDPLVAVAYQQLERQTDRQFAALTDPQGPYRITVVDTSEAVPYFDARELAASVLTSRILEVTMSSADRAHPLLGGELGGAYYRFRAVHDLIGHVATGYEFDRDGEYSAWVVQRPLYTGLARWAAATELHGEISALWATGQFAEHKAVLLDRHLLHPLRSNAVAWLSSPRGDACCRGCRSEGDRDRGQGPRAGCRWVAGAAGCAGRPR
jgi:hypothetical protein